MKKHAEFNLTEEDVADALGLSREDVRQLRADELYLDEDFINEAGGRGICYAASAIEKLRLVLKESAAPGAKLGDLAISPVGSARTDTDGHGQEMGQTDKPFDSAQDRATVILDAVVTKIYPHNPHYLEALLGVHPINVRVNSNANFIPGMIIPSQTLSKKNPRQYDFIGRCPRGRGAW
jgi:hypothetical protein